MDLNPRLLDFFIGFLKPLIGELHLAHLEVIVSVDILQFLRGCLERLVHLVQKLLITGLWELLDQRNELLVGILCDVDQLVVYDVLEIWSRLDLEAKL